MNPNSKCLNSSNALSACSHHNNINPAGDQHDPRHLGKHPILADFVGATMPPRDPDDDEDEEDEEDGGDAEDDREPAVISDEDWSSIGAHFNNGRCAKRRAASPHGGNAPIRCVCENINRP
jgi:hypothetical protein